MVADPELSPIRTAADTAERGYALLQSTSREARGAHLRCPTRCARAVGGRQLSREGPAGILGARVRGMEAGAPGLVTAIFNEMEESILRHPPNLGTNICYDSILYCAKNFVLYGSRTGAERVDRFRLLPRSLISTPSSPFLTVKEPYRFPGKWELHHEFCR